LRKIIIILLLPLFVAGCSVIGRSGKSLAKDYINPIDSNIFESSSDLRTLQIVGFSYKKQKLKFYLMREERSI